MKNIYLFVIYLTMASSLEAQIWKETSLKPGSRTVFDFISMPNSKDIWMLYPEIDSSYFTYTKTYLIRSEDGGVSWKSTELPFNLVGTVENLFAFDNTTAWIVMNDFVKGPAMYKTINGGVDWTQELMPVNGFVNVIHFFDSLNGVLLADPASNGFEIFTTKDAGVNWVPIKETLVEEVDEYAFRNVSFAGDSIWYPTVNGRTLFSADKGNSWKPLDYRKNNLLWTAEKDLEGNLYLAYVALDISNNPKLTLMRTSDNGITLKDITPIDNNWWILDIATIPGTRNLIAQFNKGFGGLQVETRVSYDYGESWTTIDDKSYPGTMKFLDNRTGITGRWDFVVDDKEAVIYNYNGSPITGMFNGEHLNLNLSIWPNPTQSKLEFNVVNTESKEYLTYIHDFNGKLFYKESSKELPVFTKSLDIQNLPQGNYILSLSTVDGKISKEFQKIK